MAGEVTVHSTLGLFYDFIVVSAALYGAGCLQGWLYFRNNSRGDSWAVKATVVLVLVCDTAQMILISMMLYRYMITHYGDPKALARMEKTVLMESFPAGIIAFAVQNFYCWKLWLLTRSYLITGVIFALSVATLSSVFVYVIIAFQYDQLEELLRLTRLCTALNTLGAVTDVAISGAIIYALRQQKTPFKKTSDMINRLIFFTFNSGLPTSVCAVLNVITLNVTPNSSAYICFFFLLGRFYTNSLLVTLNSREYIRYGSEVEADESGAMPAFVVSISDRTRPDPSRRSTMYRIEESIGTQGHKKFEDLHEYSMRKDALKQA